MYIKHLFQSLLYVLCSCLLFSCQESDLGGLTLSSNAEPHYVITTDVSTLNLSADKQEKTIEVKSNCAWTVECAANWITVKTQSGHQNGTLYIIVDYNVYADVRQGSLLLYSEDGVKQQTVVVVQSGTEYYLRAEKTSLSLSSGTQDISLTITTNDTWTAECSESWITLVQKEGKGGQTLSFKVAENAGTTSRTGTVTVKGKVSGIQLQIQVIQAGKDSTSEKKNYTVNGVTFTMIPILGGTFQMGATSEQQDPYSNERPVHSVTLSDYSIGETEVTQALWKAVMGNNPSYYNGDNLPVEDVSWDDCQTFIQKLNASTGANFRLPTEAEWEYAARGGNQSRKTQYAGSSNITDVAWYDGNSGEKTHAVKTKQPNELGLYDMSGNVWEFCQDWYGSYSSSSQTNPTGPTSGSDRVGRGGSWGGNAGYCRTAFRNRSTPTGRYINVGLRLAL